MKAVPGVLVPEAPGVLPPNLKPPKGVGAAAGVEGLLASSLAGSAGLAPKEKPAAAGAGASLFSAGLAPNEKPEAAGAGADGASFFSAGFAPNENPDAAGAAAGVVVAVEASAGLPKEKVEAGGLEAGVVEPAAALFVVKPENKPPPALPALVAAGVVAPVFEAVLFPNANDGIALLDEAAGAVEAELVFALVCPNPPKEGAGEAAGVVEPAALLAAPNKLNAGFGAGVWVAGLEAAAPEAAWPKGLLDVVLLEVLLAAPPKLNVGVDDGAVAGVLPDCCCC